MTVADALRQPLTWLATGLALALLALSWLFGMFNFDLQDRMRMVCTSGVAVALVNGLFLSVVTASQAVHDELASRTALTLFAKPLSRGSFLVGKALGVWMTVAASCLVVALAHFGAIRLGLATGFELEHDRWSEGADLVAPWAPVAAAHLLGLAHAAVMATIATVLALRLPLVANIIACFALFVLGHLLAGFGWAGAVVVPGLALFNLDDAIQLGEGLSWAYVAGTVGYALLFCGGWLCLGLALFERQDIP